MVLDSIWDTWKDFEGVYKSKGGSATRYEFLEMYLGAEDAIETTKQLIERDFVKTSESLKKFTELVQVLARTKTRMAEVKEIEDLNEFIWSDKFVLPSDLVDVRDYELVKIPEFVNGKSTARKGFAGSVYTIKGNKITTFQVSPNSTSAIRVRDMQDGGRLASQALNGTSEFQRSCLACLLVLQRNGELGFPITFTRFSPRGFNPETKLKKTLRLSVGSGMLDCKVDAKIGKQIGGGSVIVIA